jgi:hypothetical protein
MIPDEVHSHIQSSLQDYEALPTQYAVPGLLVRPARELARLSDVAAANLIVDEMANHPQGGPALLEAMVRAAPDEPRLLVVLVRTLWLFGGSQTQRGRDLAEDIADVVPLMSSEMRSVVFHCFPELLDPARWREGLDYVPINRGPAGPPIEPERWAPSDSVLGQRQRLCLLGYLSEVREGPWDLSDRVGVILFQFDHGFDATGVLDARSTKDLDDLAWGAFYLREEGRE